MTTTATSAGTQPKSSIRETFISIIIAFAMAFVFRGFVVEAFLIPTGSMAPTLLGAHMRFQSPATGYNWPTDTRDREGGNPVAVQGGRRGEIRVHDPMSGTEVRKSSVPVSWGDRIFVMKYLYSVYEPARFDVVVFKNPTDPTQNYIKRLLGLPGEQVALVDGDVFVRTPRENDPADKNPWSLEGWKTARKPERAQRAMWQEVFTSERTPMNVARFRGPWRAAPGSDPAAWSIAGKAEYTFTGSGPTALAWDASVRAIDDSYAYNEPVEHAGSPPRFPVSDVRLSLGVRPDRDGLVVSPVVVTRGHEFRATIEGATAILKYRRYGGPQRDLASPAVVDLPPGAWVELDRAELALPLEAGKFTNIEFWHVDQSLVLFVGGERVAFGEYTWNPDERLRYTLGTTAEQAALSESSLLADAGYSKPEVRWEFDGAGGFTLERVGLSRDIHYRADQYHGSPDRAHSREGHPAKFTHPTNSTPLSPDQLFVCGDNSPMSLDGRLWDVPSPWVAELDETMGVVHRDLLIGKAFWVYFPAPARRQGIPIPDFGRMRFVW